MPLLRSELIDAAGRCALPPAAVYSQLRVALAFLWRHGWAYTDVKPPNLRRSERGELVLVDLDSTHPPPNSVLSIV